MYYMVFYKETENGSREECNCAYCWFVEANSKSEAKTKFKNWCKDDMDIKDMQFEETILIK